MELHHNLLQEVDYLEVNQLKILLLRQLHKINLYSVALVLELLCSEVSLNSNNNRHLYLEE